MPLKAPLVVVRIEPTVVDPETIGDAVSTGAISVTVKDEETAGVSEPSVAVRV